MTINRRVDPFFDSEPCWLAETNAHITAFYQTAGACEFGNGRSGDYKAERRACRKRQSGYVFEQNKQGYYTVAVYDPLASVISYLRDEKYVAGHNCDVDIVRIYALLDAIELCNEIANQAVN